MAGLKPREKKQLMVLGVLLVLVVIVNFKTIKKKLFGSSSARVRGRRAAATSSRRRVAARGGRRASGARRGGRRRGRALTPNDIPVLSEETKRKLKALKNPKVDLISMDELRYETRNPFLPMELTDKEVEQAAAERKAKAKGDTVMAETLYFRGVLMINGEKYAIIERPDRTLPWYVKEGERLEDSDFVLQNIDQQDRQISLFDTKAKRERDKIRTIPYSGLEDLSFLEGGEGGDQAAGNAQAGPAIQPGKGPRPLEKPDKDPGEDDFEILE